MKIRKRSLLSTAVLTAIISSVYAAPQNGTAPAQGGATPPNQGGNTPAQGGTDPKTPKYTKQKIGDLEIYKAAEAGGATLTMMLDISGSMNSSDINGQEVLCRVQFGVTPNPDAIQHEAKTIYLQDAKGNKVDSYKDANGNTIDISGGITYTEATCSGVPTRLTKLKNAMFALVSGENALDKSNKIGVGVFPHKLIPSTGAIEIPAKMLDDEHRWRILKYIADLEVTAATPSAHAYAEIGAYMLGTNTATPTGIKHIMTEVGSLKATGGIYTLKYCGYSNIMGSSGLGRPAETLTFDGKSYDAYACTNTVDFPYRSKNWVSGSFNYTPAYNADAKAIDFGLLPSFSAYFVHQKTSDKMTNSEAKNADWYKIAAASGDIVRFLNKYTIQLTDNRRSGFGVSHPDTKKADGTSYQSPVKDAECSGQGIYFMTDGEPNRSDEELASKMMAQSLGKATYTAPDYGAGTTMEKGDVDTIKQICMQENVWKDAKGNIIKRECRLWGDSSQFAYSLWNYIGAYSKDLRAKGLKTATLGFGYVFNPTDGLKYKDAVGSDGKTVKTVDCERSFSTPDARNLCRLGAPSYGFGEGGFLATSEADKVTQSVIDFAASLNQSIPTSPAGTISIPDDPLSISNIQPYAYLPMIQPEVAKPLATWEGNLKKYHTLYGTLYGKDNKRLYVKSDNATDQNKDYPSQLNKEAMDLWQTGDSQSNNAQVDIGGARNQLPSSGDSSRTVYVESRETINGKVVDTMVGVSVKNKTLQNFDKLDARYSGLDMAYLLNYLGYDVSTEANTYSGDRSNQLTQLQNQLKNAAVAAKPYMGGVAHSVPVLATYGGKFDDATGDITSNEADRQDHLIYGSMEGVLHMVKAGDGKEVFGFIPRAMFEDEVQKTALKQGSTHTAIGQPRFGVDGPWSVNASYEYTADGMQANKMHAYGGLRMGGVGFYGLDIKDQNNPKLLFSINANTTGFERLGQTWSKPLVAKIRTGEKGFEPDAQGNMVYQDKTTDVLIFGGGYDMCYEDPEFKLNDADNKDDNCKNKTEAQGNAVYMVDASDGKLLQKWTSANNTNMKHSIVSEIVGRDRNNDGVVDHLYFGDLGGQVFRVDLKDGIVPDGNNNMTRRVVRLFDANKGTFKGSHLPFRFYEKPAVSIHKVDSGRIAMVNISSGDRSSPAHPYRALDDANRIYGIIDRDVATARANTDGGDDQLLTKDLGNDELSFYDTADTQGVGENASDAKRKEHIDNLKEGKKQGWYYTMTRFETYEKVKNLKSIGSSITTGNIYYASVYNPEYDYTTTGGCSAKILGGTERQLFCLPWGICANPETGKRTFKTEGGTETIIAKNGTLGYIKGGPGIQELAITTLTNTPGKSTRYSTIVGNQTVDETNEFSKNPPAVGGNDATKTGENKANHTLTGGNPLSNRGVGYDSFTMKVKRWYDLANAEKQ